MNDGAPLERIPREDDASVGRPCRRAIRRGVRREALLSRAICIHDIDLLVPIPPGYEGDAGAVRRPGRIRVRRRVVGQPDTAGSVRIHDVDVDADTGAAAGERDPPLDRDWCLRKEPEALLGLVRSTVAGGSRTPADALEAQRIVRRAHAILP